MIMSNLVTAFGIATQHKYLQWRSILCWLDIHALQVE